MTRSEAPFGGIDSRQVTEALLAQLRQGRWRPRAWGRFWRTAFAGPYSRRSAVRGADALADAAFWTWFARAHEGGRSLRLAAYLTWAAPPAAVAVISVVRGRMDPPRTAALRPAAALQLILAARGLRPRRTLSAHEQTASVVSVRDGGCT